MFYTIFESHKFVINTFICLKLAIGTGRVTGKRLAWKKVIVELFKWYCLYNVSFSLGNTIYQFLQRCLDSLRKDFHELKTISADQLMYVKEDLIIPHHYSFYDFIVTKVSPRNWDIILSVTRNVSIYLLCFITSFNFNAFQARGKSGPLFSFDVHDDIRIVSDASVEKDESHAGKVLLRNWYERNKHIFPASRYRIVCSHCICLFLRFNSIPKWVF